MLFIAINTKKDDLCTNPGHHSIHLGESQVIFKRDIFKRDIFSQVIFDIRVFSSNDLPKMYSKVIASHFFGKTTKGLTVFDKKYDVRGILKL